MSWSLGQAQQAVLLPHGRLELGWMCSLSTPLNSPEISRAATV
jgi:hypothetical protein